MRKLSLDIKYMYKANTGYNLMLVVTNEATNYRVTISLYRGTSYEIGEVLPNNEFVNMLPKLFEF